MILGNPSLGVAVSMSDAAVAELGRTGELAPEDREVVSIVLQDRQRERTSRAWMAGLAFGVGLLLGWQAKR